MQYNTLNRKDYGYKSKRNLKMQEINRYIDLCLIDEYATKDEDGYTLDLDNLSESTKSNFLDMLMKHDTSIRDVVLYHMQKLINERLPECEANDRLENGIHKIHLSNGDTYLTKGNYYE